MVLNDQEELSERPVHQFRNIIATWENYLKNLGPSGTRLQKIYQESKYDL